MINYLFVSTPVGPLGSGIGGGVELNLTNLARQLVAGGDSVTIVAPEGSCIDAAPCLTVTGVPPEFAQSRDRSSSVEMPLPSVLANMWDMARQQVNHVDLIVNWAYDWLPFYLTPFLPIPIAHIVSMGSLNTGLDQAIAHIARHYPGTVAVHSQAQANTFPQADRLGFEIIPCGIDITRYTFVETASAPLCWVGRIAPEKGLEDCAALSSELQQPITIVGKMQDRDYWQRIHREYPQAQLDYRGFLPTDQLQAIVGPSCGLIMTPKWIEAFGMVAVEALACGVPVITYQRGGPAEIIDSGHTGWVVTPDSVSALAKAVSQLDTISRHACRERAIARYSLEAMQLRFEQWTATILSGNHSPH